MNINFILKKRIAKEIIILFSYLFLVLIVWGVIHLRYLSLKKEHSKISDKIENTLQELSDIDELISGEVILISVIFSYINLDEALEKEEEFKDFNLWIDYLQKQLIDTLRKDKEFLKFHKNYSIYKIQDDSNRDINTITFLAYSYLEKIYIDKDYLKSLFASNFFNLEMLESYLKIKPLKKQLDDYRINKYRINLKIYNNKELLMWIKIFVLITCVVIYPLRIVYYTLQWAIRTLRK